MKPQKAPHNSVAKNDEKKNATKCRFSTNRNVALSTAIELRNAPLM